MDHTTIAISLGLTSLLVLLIASIMFAMRSGGKSNAAEKPAEPVFHVPNGRNEYRDIVGRTVCYRKSRKSLRRGVKEFGKAVLLGSRWRYRDGKLRLVAVLENEDGTRFTRVSGFEVA